MTSTIDKLLLENGADVNAKDNLDCTPLHMSVDRLAPTELQNLLEHRADANAVGKYNRTPLSYAFIYNK